MDSFNVDSGTLAEVLRADEAIKSSLMDQQRLLQTNADLARQLKQDLQSASPRSGGRRSAAAPADAFGDLTLQASPSGSDDPFRIAPRQDSSVQREKFERMMDESIRRRADRFDARAAGSRDNGINARQIGRSPHELLDLLRGDINPRSLHGLADATAFGAQEAGLKDLSKGAGAVADMVGGAFAGLGGVMTVTELANSIMEHARNSSAGQAAKFAQENFIKAFKDSDAKSRFLGESTTSSDAHRSVFDLFAGTESTGLQSDREKRIADIGKMLGSALYVSPSSVTASTFMEMASTNGSNSAQRSIELEEKLRGELSTNIAKLEKSPKGRAFLQQQFKSAAFSDGQEDVADTVHAMLEHGDSAFEISGNFRRAAGSIDAMEVAQRNADYAVARSPVATAFYRNEMKLKREIEEQLLMSKQGWNET